MTDSFLGLDQEVSKCDEGERQGDCRSRSYLRAVEERCDCVPSSLKQYDVSASRQVTAGPVRREQNSLCYRWTFAGQLSPSVCPPSPCRLETVCLSVGASTSPALPGTRTVRRLGIRRSENCWSSTTTTGSA